MSDDRPAAEVAPRDSYGVHAASPEPTIEAALYALAARQAVLAELGLLALAARSLSELLDKAVGTMRTTMEVDTCSVLELVHDVRALRTRAGAGWAEPSEQERVLEAGGRSHAEFTLLAREPVVVRDFAEETRFTVTPLLRALGIQSGVAVIIHGRDRPFGVISILHRQLRQFSREEVDYLQAVANVLALAAERLQTEEGLRRSEESFRSLIEHAPEGVLITRRERIVYVNRALFAGLGHDAADDLLGRPALELVHAEDRAALSREIRRMVETGAPAPSHELRLLRKGGGVVLVESRAMPIVFHGEPSFAALTRDVTERRKLEEQLRQSERLSSLGVLAAGVAHEINNPLTYVLGNLDLARQGLAELCAEPPPGRAEPAWRPVASDVVGLLDEARSGGDRVRRIVADLKTFSRSGAADPLSPIDLRAVVDSSAKLASNEIRPRARLEIQHGAPPRVMGDESRLGQVMLNLLLNAAQAIPDGAAQSHAVTVTTSASPDGRAILEVRDTGVGIPKEILGKVFDPFFTTKPRGVGTGLGLAICHEIVAALGGSTAIESEVGRGTCVRISLPPAPPGTVAEVHRPAALASPPLSRGRVLVVDDEPLIAALCRRVLEGEHDVEVLTMSTAALSRLERSPEVDVILCDLMMPELNGMELFEAVRARAPHLAPRFVFLSGGAFTPAAHAFREEATNPFLDKPFNAQELRTTVGERIRLARSGQP